MLREGKMIILRTFSKREEYQNLDIEVSSICEQGAHFPLTEHLPLESAPLPLCRARLKCGQARSSSFLEGRCHCQVRSPFSLGGPSFLTSMPRFSLARRNVLREIPFSFAASLTSFELTGPLLSSASRKCLALSISLGD